MNEKIENAKLMIGNLKDINNNGEIDIDISKEIVFIEKALNQAEENEKALEIIARYTKITNNRVMADDINIDMHLNQVINQTEFDLVKKVVEKYGR